MAAHAASVFSSSSSSSKSWFWRLRELCLQYNLPHPATWLSSCPTKLQVKSLTKAAVHQYWVERLRSQADPLSSLQYLQTRYLGLSKCHPLFRTCRSSPWEVEKATTQARLLSGRYRLEALTGHWVPWNRNGLCTLPECWGTPASHKGTVETFLLSCPSLTPTRLALAECTKKFLEAIPEVVPLVNVCLALDQAQFWLDCSTMSPVISAVQVWGECVLFALFKLTRNYCHVLHKARIAQLSA